jgi:hypothetical protein
MYVKTLRVTTTRAVAPGIAESCFGLGLIKFTDRHHRNLHLHRAGWLQGVICSCEKASDGVAHVYFVGEEIKRVLVKAYPLEDENTPNGFIALEKSRKEVPKTVVSLYSREVYSFLGVGIQVFCVVEENAKSIVTIHGTVAQYRDARFQLG